MSKGVTLNVLLGAATLLVTTYLPIPTGMKGVVILFATVGLAAGSGVGWYYKETLKSGSPIKPLLISLLVAVIAGAAYFILGSSPGMTSAIGVVVAAAIFFAAAGVIFAIVGIKLDAPSDN